MGEARHPVDEAPAFGTWVKGVMEEAIKLRVPVVAEVKIGTNWQDMEKLK